jgi:hypothetical protein
MTASAASPPVMTPRKERGLEMFAREQQLLGQQSAFDRERTRVFTETGQKVSGKESQVSREERAVRAELRALAAERARLLEDIAAEEARLRPRLAAFNKARHAADAKPGRGKKKPPVATKAERKVRDALALLQSERAHVDGTVGRDRGSVANDDVIWNTCFAPDAFSKDDW